MNYDFIFKTKKGIQCLLHNFVKYFDILDPVFIKFLFSPNFLFVFTFDLFNKVFQVVDAFTVRDSLERHL